MSRLSENVRAEIKRSFISGYSSGGGSSYGTNGEAGATYNKWYYGDCNSIVERIDTLESDYNDLLASHNALVEACHGLLGAYRNGEFEPSMRFPLVVRESALRIVKIARAEVDRLLLEES